MKIKNVKLFRRRAKSHADAGHIAQGTYGRGNANGKVEFQGCAVACLAAPHQKRALGKFIKDQLKKIGERPGIGAGLKELGFSGSGHKKALTREFGLVPELLVLLEGFFEAQRTHGAAINLIPAFADVLNEGADIKPGDVQRFVRDELRLTVTQRRPGSYYRWQTVPLDIKKVDWTQVRDALQERNVSAQTRKFIAWVEAQTA